MYEMPSIVILSALAMIQSYEMFYGLNQTHPYFIWARTLVCRWQYKLPFFNMDGQGNPFFFFDAQEVDVDCWFLRHGLKKFVSVILMGSSKMVVGRSCLSRFTDNLYFDKVKASFLL